MPNPHAYAGDPFKVEIWETTIACLNQIHLPIFFLIAGFLYGGNRFRGGYLDKVEFVWKKILRVIVPYVIVGTFMCFVQKRSACEMMLGVSHLWFLMTIFECYVLGIIFDPLLFLSIKKKFCIMGLCCVVVVFTMHWSLHTRFLTMDKFLHYFPLYLIGMFVGTIDIRKYAGKRKFLIALMIPAMFVLPLQHYFFLSRTFDQICGLCIVIPFFLLFRTTHFTKFPNWLGSLDRYSMGIYILHQILQQEMNKVQPFYGLMVGYEYIYPLMQFVFLILFCWYFTWLAHHSKYAKFFLG